MGDKTGIEWTDATWNPTTGCDKVSAGCDHCYALTQAARLKAMGQPKYQTDGNPKTSGPGFGLAMHYDALDQPLRWTRPRKVFVNSMSDLFHEGVTREFLIDVFAIMALARQHVFQVLTKRHGRMQSILSRREFMYEVWGRAAEIDPNAAAHAMNTDGPVAPWPLPNVWLGVSVENQKWAETRIPRLLDTPAAVRFLSMEPLLGPVNVAPFLKGYYLDPPQNAATIDWVIVGGESGKDSRPMHPQWVRDIREDCEEAGTAFLFKQWGNWHPRLGGPWLVNLMGEMLAAGSPLLDETRWQGIENVGKKAAGRTLDGRTYDGYPEVVGG